MAAAVGLLAWSRGEPARAAGQRSGAADYPADLVDSLVLLFLAMIAAGVLAVMQLWPDRHLPVRARRAGAGT